MEWQTVDESEDKNKNATNNNENENENENKKECDSIADFTRSNSPLDTFRYEYDSFVCANC